MNPGRPRTVTRRQVAMWKRESAHDDNYLADFPFNELPVELRAMIIENLGSRFFCEDIGRLTICKGWYVFALPTMYRDLLINKLSQPLTPYGSPGLIETDRSMAEFASKTMERYLSTWTLDLDKMLQMLCFRCSDYDVSPGPDIAQRQWTIDLGAKGHSWGNFAGEALPRQPESVEEGLACAQNVVASYLPSLPASKKLREVKITMIKSWGIHRLQVFMFEGVLAQQLGILRQAYSQLDSPSEGLSLVLDMPGLARRDSLWYSSPASRGRIEFEDDPFFHSGLSQNIALHIDDDDRLPLFGIGADEPPVYPWTHRHMCPAIKGILPYCETVHIRLRSVCSSLFRDCDHEQRGFFKEVYPDLEEEWFNVLPPDGEDARPTSPEPQLPRLKELVISLILPVAYKYRLCRAVHCATFDFDITRDEETMWAQIAIKQMKQELLRLCDRMPNATRVLLRYTVFKRRSRQVVFIEFDVLKQTQRRIWVDKRGNVTPRLPDEETSDAEILSADSSDEE